MNPDRSDLSVFAARATTAIPGRTKGRAAGHARPRNEDWKSCSLPEADTRRAAAEARADEGRAGLSQPKWGHSVSSPWSNPLGFGYRHLSDGSWKLALDIRNSDRPVATNTSAARESRQQQT